MNELPVFRAEDPPLDNPAVSAPWREDERWLLVRRIVASHGFQRAGQLRRILEHITRVTIEQPGVVLREYEIACDVLERRSNFDPASDNIVRQQMSQLRRRLEQYYEEVPNETLRLTIPKGSYAPHFERIAPAITSLTEQAADPRVTVTAAQPQPRGGVTLSWPLLTVSLALMLILPVAAWWLRGATPVPLFPAASPGSSNAFVEFLARANGRVTIVQPDLSLVLVQNALDLDVSPQEYSQPDSLQKHLDAVPDVQMRELLRQLSIRHATSVDEAAICSDIQDELAARGKSVAIRFARDLHTRDFGDGNMILIGSRRSDPWTLLFTKNTNFQFVSAGKSLYKFVNTQQQPGEEKVYVPYQRHEGNITSYVDVVFGPNLTQSGYVLIINGSDAVANVAAARYLFRGKLRPDLVALLQKQDLARFELFLRGSHTENEAEDSFDLVAVHSVTN